MQHHYRPRHDEHYAPRHESRHEARLVPNVHEMLKQELARDTRDAPHADGTIGQTRAERTTAGRQRTAVVLDSFYKEEADSDMARGRLAWRLHDEHIARPGVAGAAHALTHVVAAELGEFVFPIPPDVPYALNPAPAPGALALAANPAAPLLAPAQYPAALAATAPWIHNPLAQTPHGGRVTLHLHELGSQAYTAYSGAGAGAAGGAGGAGGSNYRYNWDLRLRYAPATYGADPLTLEAAPVTPRFELAEPHARGLDKLTLSFRTPDRHLALLPDVLDATVGDDGAAAPGPYLVLTSVAHGLAVGERVRIEGFASGNGTLDAYVNRAEGHAVGVAAFTADTFSLNPSPGIGALAPPPALGGRCRVLVESRRIRVPIVFYSVLPRRTNGLELV